MHPVIYISLELKVRDLDPRLLVAAEAIKRGLHVVMGQQWALSKNIFNVPPGLFLFKTVNEIQATQMIDARDAGHAVTASDEEVLACACDACFKSGMGPTAAQLLDKFFAQSEHHAQIVIDQYQEMAEKIVITGNPRIDLLSSWGQRSIRAETELIRKKYGPYVLFNSNFAWVNSIWNPREDTKQIAIRTGRLVEDDPNSVAAYDSIYEWERSNMEEFEKTIKWAIKNLQNHTIIIRPHPGENASYWHSAFSDLDRVLIVDGTTHIPWTLGAEVLVHTSCSTGMEATILGTPALSITPRAEAAQHEYLLTNAVNPTVNTWRDAAEALTAYCDRKVGPLADTAPYQKTLESHFPEIGGGQAAAKIGAALLSLVEQRGGMVDPKYSWNLRSGHPWIQVERRSEWIQKFSVDSEELASRLKAMGNLVGLKESINIQKIDDSLFLVFPG